MSAECVLSMIPLPGDGCSTPLATGRTRRRARGMARRRRGEAAKPAFSTLVPFVFLATPGTVATAVRL